MTRLDGNAICRSVVIATGFLTAAGCGQQPPETVPEPATSPSPEISSTPQPIDVNEGELLTFSPTVTNRAQIPESLVFEVQRGQLPQGCALDEATGALSWTPGETQGPGSYALHFTCRTTEESSVSTEYRVDVNVVETNQAPQFQGPDDLTAEAGSTLEQSIDLVDVDFPANHVTLKLQSGPEGAVVDELSKLLYWEIPQDWQVPQVEFTITAQDNGTPPQTTVQTLVATVTGIRKPVPKTSQPPPSRDRIPEFAVDLPALPQTTASAAPVKPVPLDLQLDPPVRDDDVRLSLLLPRELRPLLKTRYLDDDESRLAILLTDPFKPADVPGNLTDGIVATCEVIDSRFEWTWAKIVDFDARGYQNNIRHGVLTVDSRSDGSTRLVALQQVEDVPAPTLSLMLDSRKTKYRLSRPDRVKKTTPLEGINFVADNGSWTVHLTSHLDGFSSVLSDPRLAERVNARAPSQHPRFVEFGFRLLPGDDEITIELAAVPSPVTVLESFEGAKKSLRAKQDSYRRWNGKLRAANSALSSAQALPENNKVQRAKKRAAVSSANNRIRQADANLAKLSREIPADENLVAKMEAEWQAVRAKLEPVRRCMISGELWRRIEDVRVPVLRLIPVDQNAVPGGGPVPTTSNGRRPI